MHKKSNQELYLRALRSLHNATKINISFAKLLREFADFVVAVITTLGGEEKANMGLVYACVPIPYKYISSIIIIMF